MEKRIKPKGPDGLDPKEMDKADIKIRVVSNGFLLRTSGTWAVFESESAMFGSVKSYIDYLKRARNVELKP